MKKKVVKKTTPVNEPGQADVPGLVEKIKSQAAEIGELNQFVEKAKTLLHIYDGMDDGDYMKYLDSFVLAAERKYDKVLENSERLALRGAMKDFIGSYMADKK